jgi:DNA-binding transcriptional ArsR family regulator
MNVSELQKNAAKATRLLTAMANEKRLMILCQLVDGEKAVGELAQRLDTRPSTVSQHLALLRKDGFVVARRDAQTLYYSLAADEPRTLIEALHSCYCEPRKRVSQRSARQGDTT